MEKTLYRKPLSVLKETFYKQAYKVASHTTHLNEHLINGRTNEVIHDNAYVTPHLKQFKFCKNKKVTIFTSNIRDLGTLAPKSTSSG